MPSHRHWLALALLCAAACAQETESPTAPTPPTGGPNGAIIAGSGVWGTRTSMPFGQQQHAVGAMGGKLYTIGGFDDDFNNVDTVQEYTPATDSWRGVAPLPVPVHDPMTVTIGNRLYVAGGCSNLGQINQLLYYQSGPNVWTSLTPMNNGRCRSPIAVAGGMIYVFGTQLSGADGLVSEVYDPASNAWYPIADMPAYGGSGGSPSRAATIDGKIYIYQIVSGVKRLDIYDPTLDSWSTGSVPGGLVPFQFVGAVVAGKFYELQPQNGFSHVSFGYDPATDQWTDVADDPYTLFNTSAVAIGKTIYQAGGQLGGHAVGNVQTFTPAFAGNHLPDVMFNMSRGTEGTAVQFNATTTTDADGDPLSYTWSFGDGGVATGTTPTHTYADNGVYSVTLTVDDGVGCAAPGSCQLTKNLTVVNAKPLFGPGFTVDTLPVGIYSASSSFTDPGTADTWTATVDYGDGSGVQPLALAGQNFSLQHLYTNAGAFYVTVTITDDDGGSRAMTRKIRVTAH